MRGANSEPQGQACLAILAFAVTLWVTETLPFAVTSLLVVVLIPVFGLADYRTVVRAGFGDPIVTFFLGVLMLSSAFTWVLLGQITVVPELVRPFVIVMAVAGLHLLFSSNTVTASIIVPILVALARDLHLDIWATWRRRRSPRRTRSFW